MTLTPSGFFHLRSPLLPAAVFDAVAEGGLAAVRRLTARGEVAEAVYLASPGLAARWTVAEVDDDRLGAAVGAYVVRMATRSTPFGLFAGAATGTIADGTDLRVPPLAGLSRRSRIDTGVLAAVAEALERDPASRSALVFRPTSSLYRAAGSFRYVEARTSGGNRTHHLVALDVDDALRDTLDRASAGATVGDLARALTDDDVSLDDALGYVGELVAAGVLVSDLQPAITVGDPVDGMIEVLRRSPSTDKAAERLARARAILDGLDAAGAGRPRDAYAAVHADLSELVPTVDAARLVQVDLFKPVAGLTLGRDVADELARAVTLLHRIAPPSDDRLAAFRAAFDDRYGSRRVPLSEVLDEEAGIGFEASTHPRADESPLLAGLDLGPPPEPERRWTERDDILLDLLGDAVRTGAQTLVLDGDDLDRLTNPHPQPLPVALSVMATLLGSPEDVAAGTYRILVHGVTGPAGSQLLGRFCSGDADLEAGVRAHLAAEEAHRPDAVFAEIVHLPEGRVGNILRRRVLRQWELPYLGRSGAPDERQLAVKDLTVGVENGRVVLRCPRLDDREVLPRLATAHNTARGNLGLYRFLVALQYQGVTAGVGWSWGRLAGAPFLPRVVVDRLVLARAQWRLDADELRSLASAAGVAQLRAARRLPRLAAVADGDNELRVDLDRPASVEVGRHALAGRTSAVLVEVLDDDDDLCVCGPEGRFHHELVVPFHQAPAVPSQPGGGRPRPVTLVRRLPPGSEWLYVKAYCGPAAADAVLRDAVAPALAGERWFFVRYGDPDWHVRVRVAGDPDRLTQSVEPRLTAALAPFVDDGRVWRVQVDTYEREVERYGGDEGMVVAEELFCADSAAVAAIVALLEGSEAADARWRLALVGTHLLLDDLGYTLADRAAWARRRRDGFLSEFPGAAKLPKQLGQRFRDERADLETLLWGDASNHWLAPGLAALHDRSLALGSLGHRVRALAADGRLGVSVDSWTASVAHMHANRLLRSAARAQELAIHDLLDRLYRSRLARAGG